MRLKAVLIAALASFLLGSAAEAQQMFSFVNVFKPQAVHKLGPKPAASCGWYMRKVHGGRYGPAFNRARQWATLPRTTLRPGAVVVSARKGRGCGGPCGHVVKVRQVLDSCNAIVQDNAGVYKRNTCRARVAIVWAG